MANLNETPQWDSVPRVERTTKWIGANDATGDIGTANQAAQALANRTALLKQRLDTQATAEDPFPQYETASEVALKFASHTGAADPHPQYTTNAEVQALLYDLSPSFDFSTAISGGTGYALYSPAVTKNRGVYLVVPYCLGWACTNAGGSYYMNAAADFLSGSGSSGFINMAQDGVPCYNRSPFILRITSPTATMRFRLANEGSKPAGQGSVTITTGTNGLLFDVYRIG